MTKMSSAEHSKFVKMAQDFLCAGKEQRPIQPLPPLPEALLKRLPAQSDSGGNGSFPWKAVVFDIYGTLLSSLSGDISDGWTWYRGNLDALARQMAVDCTGEELKDYFSKAVRQEHLRSFDRTPYPEVRVEELWEAFGQRREEADPRELALRFELAVNPVWPMDGLSFLLKRLGASGLPVGIVSNAQFYTPIVLEALGCRTDQEPFDPDLCIWSYQRREAKPSPVLFEELKRLLAGRAISARETLFVGNDLLNDIYAAAQLGFSTCLFAGDASSLRLREGNPVCEGVLPDLVVQDLEQLAMLIDGPQATA